MRLITRKGHIVDGEQQIFSIEYKPLVVTQGGKDATATTTGAVRAISSKEIHEATRKICREGTLLFRLCCPPFGMNTSL